jgi:hypothetical protein
MPDMKKELLRLKLRELIREQSEGEWDDKLIEKDVTKFTEHLWELFGHV